MQQKITELWKRIWQQASLLFYLKYDVSRMYKSLPINDTVD